jgi:hypothetical protein
MSSRHYIVTLEDDNTSSMTPQRALGGAYAPAPPAVPQQPSVSMPPPQGYDVPEEMGAPTYRPCSCGRCGRCRRRRAQEATPINIVISPNFTASPVITANPVNTQSLAGAEATPDSVPTAANGRGTVAMNPTGVHPAVAPASVRERVIERPIFIEVVREVIKRVPEIILQPIEKIIEKFIDRPVLMPVRYDQTQYEAAPVPVRYDDTRYVAAPVPVRVDRPVYTAAPVPVRTESESEPATTPTSKPPQPYTVVTNRRDEATDINWFT